MVPEQRGLFKEGLQREPLTSGLWWSGLGELERGLRLFQGEFEQGLEDGGLLLHDSGGRGQASALSNNQSHDLRCHLDCLRFSPSQATVERGVFARRRLAVSLARALGS